ncbi:MAG TPA: hypothetical protein VMP68_00690 [Candidatus Eisenbacteria bacterium]|nr:hypothetical protein [Candidatus Eisenbacteria bacterium]
MPVGGGVVVPGAGVALPAGGVAVLPGGVAVLPGGVAVPAGGVAVPGVELCPAAPGLELCPAAPVPPGAAPPDGEVCATTHVAQRSTENSVSLVIDILVTSASGAYENA